MLAQTFVCRLESVFCTNLYYALLEGLFDRLFVAFVVDQANKAGIAIDLDLFLKMSSCSVNLFQDVNLGRYAMSTHSQCPPNP